MAGEETERGAEEKIGTRRTDEAGDHTRLPPSMTNRVNRSQAMDSAINLDNRGGIGELMNNRRLAGGDANERRADPIDEQAEDTARGGGPRTG